MVETTAPASTDSQELVNRLGGVAALLVDTMLGKISKDHQAFIEDGLQNGEVQIRVVITIGPPGLGPPTPIVLVSVGEPGMEPIVEWAWGSPEDLMRPN